MTSFALAKGLVEAFTKTQIGLSLCTLQELLNFPSTGTLWFVGVSSLLLYRSGRSRGLRNLRAGASTGEHSGNSMSYGVPDSGAYGDSSSSCRHLCEHTGLLGLSRHRR